jgi:predicted acetyltransferase
MGNQSTLGGVAMGTAPGPLTLRPLRLDDETAARAAHAELQVEDFPFLLGLRADEPWAAYVERLELSRQGHALAEGWVPSTFLGAEVDGCLVGRSSVRHDLNAWLARWGGHIGYAVRPAFRRRGYATAILQQSLTVAASLGIGRALVTCDVDNVVSAAVIEHCGGVLEGVAETEDGSPPKRRYWVEAAG